MIILNVLIWITSCPNLNLKKKTTTHDQPQFCNCDLCNRSHDGQNLAYAGVTYQLFIMRLLYPITLYRTLYFYNIKTQLFVYFLNNHTFFSETEKESVILTRHWIRCCQFFHRCRRIWWFIKNSKVILEMQNIITEIIRATLVSNWFIVYIVYIIQNCCFPHKSYNFTTPIILGFQGGILSYLHPQSMILTILYKNWLHFKAL